MREKRRSPSSHSSSGLPLSPRASTFEDPVTAHLYRSPIANSQYSIYVELPGFVGENTKSLTTSSARAAILDLSMPPSCALYSVRIRGFLATREIRERFWEGKRA